MWNLKFGGGGVIFYKVHSIKVKSWECSVNISTIYLSTVHFTPVSMWLNFLLRALCRRLLSDHHGLYLSAQAKVNYLQFISIVIIVIDIEIYFLFAWKDANSIGIMQWVCNEVYSLSIDQKKIYVERNRGKGKFQVWSL